MDLVFLLNFKKFHGLKEFMSLLYLVGTIHWDLKGPERLRKFLGFVRPTSICVEASQELFDLRIREREEAKLELEKMRQDDCRMESIYSFLGENPAPLEEDFTLQFLMTQGYESWVSYEHKQEENPGVRIYPVHDHRVLEKNSVRAYQMGYGSEKFDSSGAPTKSFFDELQRHNAADFQKAIDDKYHCDKDDDFDNGERLARMTQADDAMEPGVRNVIGNDSQGPIVFISGKAHFTGKYERNLTQRLQEFSPHVVRLLDVDRF